MSFHRGKQSIDVAAVSGPPPTLGQVTNAQNRHTFMAELTTNATVTLTVNGRFQLRGLLFEVIHHRLSLSAIGRAGGCRVCG